MKVMLGTFDEEWARVRPQVAAHCRRLTWNDAEADELFQRVAIRAWRGHSSFRGDCDYLTWVVAIARREAARYAAQRAVVNAREVPLEEADPVAPEPDHDTDRGWLHTAVADALVERAISEAEHRVLVARLTKPEVTWAEIGESVGETAVAAAVAHSRAVPKLRVFLFTRRPDLVGGRTALRSAFDTALKGEGGEGLTAAEAEAFEEIVLNGRRGYRRRGWQSALRAACGKVATFLPSL